MTLPPAARRISLVALAVLAGALGCTTGEGADGGAGTSPTAGAAGGSGAAGSVGSTAAGGNIGTAGKIGAAGTSAPDAGTGPNNDAAADRAAPAPDAGGGSDAVVTPTDAATGALAPMQFYGRWELKDGLATTVNSGSHVTARFQGTGVSARLDLSRSTNPVTTVTWQIDGGAWSEGNVKATLPLATGLAPGMHEVIFMARGMAELQNRWNPPLTAALWFVGFDVEGGALVPTAKPNRLKIEFLGDSITEGVRVVPDGTDPEHTNGHLAYPCLVSLALGAEWRQVGFGHQGVLQAGHGNVPKAADSFDWVYATVPREKTWVADMVVLNQGTNDRDASPTAFKPEFARYLGVIRAGYPQALIFVLRPFGGYREVEVKAETEAKIAAGDTKMIYVDTTGWLTAADYTEGLHPNIIGHQKATTQIVAELKKHLP